jgi:FlaA1/EpsC-like NDP-sugar epimerase
MMFEKPTYVPFIAPLDVLQALGDMLQESVGKSRVAKNKDVFLTGAGGFLGVHLIEELRRRKKNQVRTIYASVRSKNRAIELGDERRGTNFTFGVGDCLNNQSKFTQRIFENIRRRSSANGRVSKSV